MNEIIAAVLGVFPTASELARGFLWPFLLTLCIGWVLGLMFGQPSRIERKRRKARQVEARRQAKRAQLRRTVRELGEASR